MNTHPPFSRAGTASPFIRPFLLVALMCAMLVALSGCGSWRSLDEQVYFDPTGKNIIFRDAWVQRNPPDVYVQPVTMPPQDLRVLFVPFRVTQQIDNPTVLGYGIARTIWQTWLSMQLFPNMEFSGDDVPYRRDRAIQLARMRKADMVIGGFVTYVYAGGTVGGSQIAVQIEAHDALTGQMVWSMAQSGLMPGPKTTDYFIFATKTRMPSDPLQAIAQIIALDTGKRLQEWFGLAVPLTRTQRIDKTVKETFFSPRDPIPTGGAATQGEASGEASGYTEPDGAFQDSGN